MPLAPSRRGSRQASIDIAKTLGRRDGDPARTSAAMSGHNGAAGWKAFAQAARANMPATLAEAGLKLAWHNHDFEFAQACRRLAPDRPHPRRQRRACSKPDIGWIVRAGADPPTEIAQVRLASRRLPHQGHAPRRASPRTTAGPMSAPASSTGRRYGRPSPRPARDLLVMEHDNPSDWRAFAANSYKYVSGSDRAGARHNGEAGGDRHHRLRQYLGGLSPARAALQQREDRGGRRHRAGGRRRRAPSSSRCGR